jgi:hypothetical protein
VLWEPASEGWHGSDVRYGMLVGVGKGVCGRDRVGWEEAGWTGRRYGDCWRWGFQAVINIIDVTYGGPLETVEWTMMSGNWWTGP